MILILGLDMKNAHVATYRDDNFLGLDRNVLKNVDDLSNQGPPLREGGQNLRNKSGHNVDIM